MRSELVEIEKIEQFLEGSLSGETLTSFENKITNDAQFHETVKTQNQIVQRIHKLGKMEALNTAHQNHIKRGIFKAWIVKGLIGIVALAAAISGGKALADLKNNPEPTHTAVSTTQAGEQTTSQDKKKTSKGTPLSTAGQSAKNDHFPPKSQKSQTVLYTSPQDDTLKKDTTQAKQKVDAVEEPAKLATKAPAPEKTGFRKYGTKMYLTTNDGNAAIHFKREMGIYDTWVLVDEKEEADYHLKLYEEKDFVDRLAWIEIRAIDNGEKLYSSPKARGINGGMRTVNIKQAAIERLVHEILRHEFFSEE